MASPTRAPSSGLAGALVLAGGLLPALVLLLPALATPDAVLGDPERGIYPALHAASVARTGRDLILGYPGDLPEAALDPLLATVLRVTAAPAEQVVAGAALAGLVGGAWAFRRWARLLGHSHASWANGAMVAFGVFGPQVLRAWIDGAPAWGQSWALVAVPVAASDVAARRGSWRWARALVAGALVGLFAAPLVPAALVVALATARARATRSGGPPPAGDVSDGMPEDVEHAPVLAGLLLAAGCAFALGARPDLAHVGLADLLAPGNVRPGAPDGTRGFVGWVALLAAAAGLATREGRALGAAALACALAGIVPGGLALVPAASLLAGAGALASVGERVRRTNGGALAVLLAATVLADGARGVGVHGPLPTASLVVPEALRRLPPGPVLDLPVAPGKLRTRLYWQLTHERPAAVDAAGLVRPEILALATALAGTGDGAAEGTARRSDPSGTASADCPDPHALGFRSLVVRREAEFHTLTSLVACFGAPTRTAGDLAIWELDAPARTDK